VAVMPGCTSWGLHSGSGSKPYITSKCRLSSMPRTKDARVSNTQQSVGGRLQQLVNQVAVSSANSLAVETQWV